MKKYQVLVLIIILMLTGCGFNNADVKNDNEDIMSDNGGMFVSYKSDIYMAETDGIYRLDKSKDNFKLILKAKNYIEPTIFIDGDYMYFLERVNDTSQIVKYNIKKKSKEELVKGNISQMYVYDGKIIYTETDNKTAVFNVFDGKVKKTILKKEGFGDFVYKFFPYDNYIYYVNIEDKGYLYRVDLNGENDVKVSDNISIFGYPEFWIQDDWIYYTVIDEEKNIYTYKMRLDGTDACKVLDKDEYYISHDPDGYLYFGVKNAIYKMKDDKRIKLYEGKELSFVSVLGDYIYGKYYPDETGHDFEVYKVKNDGSLEYDMVKVNKGGFNGFELGLNF